MYHLYNGDTYYKLVIMRNKLILYLVLLSILSFSCKRKDKETSEDKMVSPIQISPGISDGSETLQSHIKNLQIIKLQSNHSVVIGGLIDKIEFVDNKYYLKQISSLTDKPIFVFDSTGNYIRSIGKHGRGPREFLSLNDMIVDNRVILFTWDGDFTKGLFYTLNGKYLKEEKLKIPISKSIKLDPNLFVFYCGTGKAMPDGTLPYTLYFTDSSFNVLSKHRRRDENAPSIGTWTSIFSEYQEAISFLGEFQDTVYLIKNKNTINPQYHLDFGDYQLTLTDKLLKKKYQNNPVKYKKTRKKEKFVMYLKYAQNSKYFWVNYHVKVNSFDKHFALYSKAKDTVYNFSCENDEPLIELLSNLVSYSGKSFVFYVQPDKFIEIAENLRQQINRGNLQEEQYLKDILNISKQVDKSDNSLLVKVTLK